MSNLKHPEDALTHPALKGQALYMVSRYLKGDRFEMFFESAGVPYTHHTRKLFDQARKALGHARRKRIGKVNPAWNGAAPRYRKGYRYLAVPGSFDRNGRTCFRPEHHLVMERVLGRPLLKTEVVHHIDNDILNNSPENLRLDSTNGVHLADTLAGKCPNWSEAGLRSINLARDARIRRAKEQHAHRHP